MDIKPTKLILNLCDEIYERQAKYGKGYPGSWKEKSRQKLEAAGYLESKGVDPLVGEVYYFTESGLQWYMEQRQELFSAKQIVEGS
jgi:hypothetical protein